MLGGNFEPPPVLDGILGNFFQAALVPSCEDQWEDDERHQNNERIDKESEADHVLDKLPFQEFLEHR